MPSTRSTTSTMPFSQILRGWRAVLVQADKRRISASAADTVITGDEFPAEWASSYARDVRPDSLLHLTRRLPSEDYVGHCDQAKTCVAWSNSTEKHFNFTSLALRELNRSTGARLTFISGPDPQRNDVPNIVDRLGWNPRTFSRELAKADIALAPLDATSFSRGKCAHKLLQYAATKLPMVGNPVGANAGALQCFSGISAKSVDEWMDALIYLVSASADERAARGRHAAHQVAAHYFRRRMIGRMEGGGRNMALKGHGPRCRVAVVSTTIPRTVDGFYGQIIDTLKADGYEVHVVTSDGPQVDRLRTRADIVHRIQMARQIHLATDVRSFVSWISLLRRVRPQVILAGTPKAAFLGLAAAALTGVPTRGYFLQGLRLEGTRGLLRTVLGRMECLTSLCSQVIVAVSPSLAARFSDLGLTAGRPVVIPHHGSSHGVDSVFFSPRSPDEDLRRELSLDSVKCVVTFVGRLTADKGPDVLITALEAIVALGIRVQLLVVGAQDEPDSLAYVERMTASKVPMVLLDHVQDIRPYLALTDILALPTRREGMPNAVLEAAAMGVPSVTTDATGAVDSVIDGKTGLVVPVDDAYRLEVALVQLIEDEGMRRSMGNAARARVVRDFQPADVARAVVDAVVGTRATSTAPKRAVSC
jgi:glycosyltransferase involved in cell wall biosynthesis